MEARPQNAWLPSKDTDTRPWSNKEDRLLKEMFNKHPREILYGYFPDRDIADIEERIRKVCFSFVAKSTRPKSAGTSQTGGKSPSDSSREIKQVDHKLEAKRKRTGQLHARPWSESEDETIARNYPRHGTTVVLWDKQLYGRTVEAIEIRARELGLSRRITAAQVQQPKAVPAHPAGSIKTKKSSRKPSTPSTSGRAGARQGPRNSNQSRKKKNPNNERPWTPGELQTLRGMYHTLMLVPKLLPKTLPGKSLGEVKAKARELGLV